MFLQEVKWKRTEMSVNAGRYKWLCNNERHFPFSLSLYLCSTFSEKFLAHFQLFHPILCPLHVGVYHCFLACCEAISSQNGWIEEGIKKKKKTPGLSFDIKSATSSVLAFFGNSCQSGLGYSYGMLLPGFTWHYLIWWQYLYIILIIDCRLSDCCVSFFMCRLIFNIILLSK